MIAVLSELLRAHPSWVHAIEGGALIGLASGLLLLVHGKTAGISGVLGGALAVPRGDLLWRSLFVAGLVAGGALLAFRAPALVAPSMPRGPWAMAAAGLLVGYGTRLGNGCTSGHGVCGIGRLAPRSLLATATFIATGMATSLLIGRLFGTAS